MSIRFGAAGISNSFKMMGFNNSLDIPAYMASFGLHAFEYQCGHGVRLGIEKAKEIAYCAQQHDIQFSVHAPYYISMSSMINETRLKSVDYIVQSCRLVRALGGRRVIFHSGSCGMQSRTQALEKAMDTMCHVIKAIDTAGYDDIILCPETMGKIGQLGNLDEVLTLCSVDKRIVPCIDFGHLNARTLGGIQTKQDYIDILNHINNVLMDERSKCFHVHFSRIEWTKGGEKRHWTFADTQFGPEYKPLLELLHERNIEPVVICESAGTQAEDATTMQKYYQSL